jgi:hypothetical protein
VRVSVSGRAACSRTPRVEATAWGTREESASDASSTSHTPSSNTSTSSPAATTASLVLPHPPGPVSVSKRLFSSNRSTSASSFSRPTKLESSSGKLSDRRSEVRGALSASAGSTARSVLELLGESGMVPFSPAPGGVISSYPWLSVYLSCQSRWGYVSPAVSGVWGRCRRWSSLQPRCPRRTPCLRQGRTRTIESLALEGNLGVALDHPATESQSSRLRFLGLMYP